ncbi:biogenesis of lysosome-related organelles complex-1 subunit 2-domain-containing protein [Fimicolochytrium jonesii]|uniref:biogenesis of lysosome-related organelles complex-1 subunit 2-domain-containing protein n=1 Tax=Fimicolochytrium jonesii TaxID=1396493 RepID=UPI0022FE5FBA|nr:biogenesis of lysosome-related organelles complex-1 subunit 2-domain-containing protein [Fimicolochytrium jonesii]KAI8820727.1 biogenesis of lysosome-related organelles complex-1 subunit 2-domain-containing protein [Fimicolochytrium jonesii]
MSTPPSDPPALPPRKDSIPSTVAPSLTSHDPLTDLAADFSADLDLNDDSQSTSSISSFAESGVRNMQVQTSLGVSQQQQQQQPPVSPRSTSLSPTALTQSRLLRLAEAQVDIGMGKVAEHLRAEIVAAVDDLTVLQQMTAAARDVYIDYSATAQELVAGMGNVQRTYAEMETYLNQIFDLERQVSSMEAVVNELDDYTKRIETSVKRGR